MWPLGLCGFRPEAAGIYELSVHARYRYQSAYRPQGIHPHPRTQGRKRGPHSRDGQLSNPVSYGSFLKLNILIYQMGICIPSSWSCCEKHTNPANAQQTTWHRFGRRMVLRTPILHSPVLHPFQWALPPLSSRIGSIFPPLGSEFCCLSCFGLKMCFRTSVSALVPGFHPRWPT